MFNPYFLSPKVRYYTDSLLISIKCQSIWLWKLKHTKGYNNDCYFIKIILFTNVKYFEDKLHTTKLLNKVIENVYYCLKYTAQMY